MIAPVDGSGSCPACIALVANPISKKPFRYCHWLTYRESGRREILKIRREKRKRRFRDRRDGATGRRGDGATRRQNDRGIERLLPSFSPSLCLSVAPSPRPPVAPSLPLKKASCHAKPRLLQSRIN